MIPVADGRPCAFQRHRTWILLPASIGRKDPFLRDRSHLLRPELDVEAMNEACKALIGKQDFSSFCKAGSDVKTTHLRCAPCRVGSTCTGGLSLHASRADRYLRNMVRAIVGTCIRIGKGQQPAAQHGGGARRAGPGQGREERTGLRAVPRTRVIYPFIRLDAAERMSSHQQGKAFDRKLFARVFAFTKPYRTIFWMTFALTILLAGLGVVRPLLMGDMIDDYALTGDQARPGGGDCDRDGPCWWWRPWCSSSRPTGPAGWGRPSPSTCGSSSTRK